MTAVKGDVSGFALADLPGLARGMGLEVSLAAAPFERYLAFLQAGAERLNLTALKGEGEAVVKHFLDSLTCLLAPIFPPGASVIDVGSGAGFPGVVLRLARPDLKVTLLDSLRRRADFLEAVVGDLGLDVDVVAARAEEAGQAPGHREAYDCAVARAVAPMAVLAEYCLPLVRAGGAFLAMKGPGVTAELAAAAGALSLLGGGEPGLIPLSLPGGAGERRLVVVPKLRPSPPGYPRRPGLPAKRPLGGE